MMKVTITMMSGRKYEEKSITNVIERVSNNRAWLVLKKKNKDDVNGGDKDYLKLALDEVESIKYN